MSNTVIYTKHFAFPSQENSILSNLIFNSEFRAKVLHHLKDTYFAEPCQRHVFKLIANHCAKYDTSPSNDTLRIDFENSGGLDSQRTAEGTAYLISELKEDKQDSQW